MRVVVCEVDLEKALPYLNLQVMFQPIPRYPGITRDIAVIVPLNVPAGQVQDVIFQVGGELLKECQIFDVYHGGQVPEGYRSLAFSLLYQSPKRTLTDEEVGEVHSSVLETLTREVGARLR